MTNWQKFKIVGREEGMGSDFVTFKLDKTFPGLIKDGRILKFWEISCFDCSLCNCQVGDYLEIDTDEIVRKNKDFMIVCNDTSMVRKYGEVTPSSSSSLSSQQITSNQIQERDERMRQWVEESGGEYEVDFIARQEYWRDGGISANELKWTYRKK